MNHWKLTCIYVKKKIMDIYAVKNWNMITKQAAENAPTSVAAPPESGSQSTTTPPISTPDQQSKDLVPITNYTDIEITAIVSTIQKFMTLGADHCLTSYAQIRSKFYLERPDIDRQLSSGLEFTDCLLVRD